AKHIDPKWIGGSLYFVADRRGVNDVFRLDLDSGSIVQTTHVAEGVSGLTALSPALSVSPAARRIAFSEYAHGGYTIRGMSLHDSALAGDVVGEGRPAEAVTADAVTAPSGDGDDDGDTAPTPVHTPPSGAEPASRLSSAPAPELAAHDSRPYARRLTL